ncbi:MAG: hypothetical protein A2Y82_05280 [Candidatus Buchananbacteria bacterium RBG_13_36_9]|uniref:Uncharacterized protein n=1 Tax=Candidatus Buchananbacteria bacterium RBG_13_36_9 TaxID=1797530 RepID=A0A1G1XMT2_9BACT|nr:MAG: hypothetical protein A2Y82_05280 [Candidatus Buchananbacteria bacterium RBG_13_36_9]
MVFLGIDWGRIFSVPFWLEVNPGELSDRFEKIFLIVLFICYGLFGAGKLWEKQLIKKRNFLTGRFVQKAGSFFITMAISFTFVFFFRYEAIPVLGGRFWVFIWLIAGLAWFIYLIKYYFVDLQLQLGEYKKKQNLKKYFQ